MNQYKLPLIVGVLLLVLDRGLKALAVRLPAKGLFCSQEIFGVKLFLNKGIAFGLPLPQVISITISILIIMALIYLLIKKKYNSFGLVLIIIGAASNLLDKIKYQAIIDLFNIKYITVFNLADLYIIIGLALIVYSYNKSKNSLFTSI